MEIIIREFKKEDELEWVRCRTLAFLDTAYYDNVPGLHPIQAFAHYVGEDKEKVKEQFKRVHECNCYQKLMN